MKYQEIKEIVNDFIEEENVLLITCSDFFYSTDVDVYIIAKNSTPSSIHIFKKDGMWHELFIDNINDVNTKLDNIDEICINLLSELDFVFGDKQIYDELIEEIKVIKCNYKIPKERLDKLIYRIKVLSPKLFRSIIPEDVDQNKFIINSISYPLIQIILSHYHIFPSSPRKWILQIKNRVSAEEYSLIHSLFDNKVDKERIKLLIEKYVNDFEGFSLDRSTNNKITFIT